LSANRLSKQLFRVKDLGSILAETHDTKNKLKKALGSLDLILLGIGAVIGAGIFATIGTAAAGDAARPGAGPALILSFAITAVACGFAALCYAEMASLVPISGSAYTYSYASFGELVAWIIGWDLIIEYGVGAIAVSISWSAYFTQFIKGFGIELPPWITLDYRTAYHGFHSATQLLQGGAGFEALPAALQRAWLAVREAPHLFGAPIIFNGPAFGIVTVLTVVLVIGIKESARFNALMVTLKLCVLAFFVSIGFIHLKPENWIPFAPNGFAGIKTGAAIVFFAYIGFDTISTTAEETKNPKKDLPIGIIGSLVICTVIYMVVAAVFTGLIPFKELTASLAGDKAEPLALAMRYVHLDWAAGIIAFGAIAAQTAVLLVLQMGQPRIFFSMARDGLLPRGFAKVHPTFKTPYVTTIVTGAFIAIVAGLTNIEEMVDLTNIGTLFAFALVCLGVIILRIKEPHRQRGFKVPLSPIVPLCGLGSCIFLMTGLPTLTWIRFFVWLALGLCVYFLYGMKHSLLHKKAS